MDEIDKPFLLDLLFWRSTGDRVAKSRARGCQPGRAAITVAPHWRHPCAVFQDDAAAIAGLQVRSVAARQSLSGYAPAPAAFGDVGRNASPDESSASNRKLFCAGMSGGRSLLPKIR
jgi:hypothetical protein